MWGPVIGLNTTDELRDDPTVASEEGLLRKIPKCWIIVDEIDGIKISSAAFRDPEMSILFLSIVESTGRKITEISLPIDGGLASINADFVRSLGQIIIRDPTTEEPAHGIVYGNKSRSVRRKIREEAVWMVSPSSVPYPP